MQKFYTRKFGRRPKLATGKNFDVLYQITIKTADHKNAGTNANVFLSIYGSKDKICRKLLTREALFRGQSNLSSSVNSLHKIHDNNLYHIEYKRGATDIVYIRCRELGNIRYIILEVKAFSISFYLENK